MRLPLRLLPLLLVIAGIAATPAAAAPSISATTKAFDIRISGTHVVDWVYASSLARQDCSTWSLGKGKLDIEYLIAGKARYELTEVRTNGRLTELQWGATRYKPMEFAITQKGEWKYNNGLRMECTPCGPLSEYGPCVPDKPLPTKPTCRRRFADGVIDTTIYREVRREKQLADVAPRKLHGAGLLVEVRYVDDDEKAAAGCFPQAGGESQPLPQPAPLVLGVNRLRDLRRGRSVSLDVSRDEYVKSDAIQDGDRCGPIEGLVKMNACGRTRITFDVKRVR